MNKYTLIMSCALSVFAVAGRGAVAADAASNAASSNSNGTTIGELVVTAQRRQENLQSVPIAVSAFSQQSLSAKGLKGGQDLLLQIPDVNYTRTNFGGFDFKIRGVGTDVIGAGGTAGVSINENELPLSANHFADTDFYDDERVEIVRGPQGTLYGRNATGGAVDIITNQPTDTFGGFASISYGNYNALKISGAVNLPLGDVFAVRVAGFRYTQDGFGWNSYLNQSVDGRDLGSIRATLSFKPSPRFSAYLLYEHYQEDDDRNRVGKQLCIPDPGPSTVGGVPVDAAHGAFLNQGCIAGPLNSPAAYGAYNTNGTLGGELANLIGLNNYANLNAGHPLQNTNLHDIASTIQPLFTAQQDIVDLHMAYKITDNLTLTSITGFNRDVGTSAEDYNRLIAQSPYSPTGVAALLFPNGVINDPQVGTSNLPRTYDYGNTESKEYTEELRLTSSFSGRLNFTAGAFYSEGTSDPGSTNYYVESNGLTAFSIFNNFVYDATYDGALAAGAPPSVAAALAASKAPQGGLINIGQGYPPNGTGHNYYDARSGGGFLKSYAGFGEVYFDVAPTLKLTLGGRYTVDKLNNLQYPISLLSAVPNNGPVFTDPGFPALGTPGTPTTAAGGFPSTICNTSTAACLIEQNETFRKFTGRVNLDWTPVLPFTDKTLVYVTYSRGYKGGGFNTPCQASLGAAGGSSAACGYPLEFGPEGINAYEIGTKNTLLGGRLTLNGDAFYYDYSGYQISQIISESSVNLNINAKIYGAEFEGVYSPVRDLIFNASIGYLHTRIDDGQTQIDTLNLTQGNPNYTLVKAASGSNCIAPTAEVAAYLGLPAADLTSLCTINANGQYLNPGSLAGIPVELGGKQLPNSPNWTVSIGAQCTFGLAGNWNATLRGDYYWQADSFARIYNAINDQLPSYHVVNGTLTFRDAVEGLELQLFVKNVFNAQPITGVYLTDPTSGLFQNVFTLDPRTFGAQLTKRW